MHLLAFRLRGMLDRLPDWLRPALIADNDHNIELANGSVGLAFPTTGGRSYTASLVVVDEADFADNLDALLAAVKPTIDAGGRLILLSTADKSKPQSAFKRIYGAGKRGENGYRAIFLPWSARPGRSAAWYEEQKRDVESRERAQRTISSRSIRRRTSRRWRPAVWIGALLLSGCVGATVPLAARRGWSRACCTGFGDLAAAATR